MPKQSDKMAFTLRPKRDYQLRYKVERRLKVKLGLQVVHHIDGNPCNNDPHNLAIMRDHADHMRWHRSLIYRRLVKLTTVAQLMKGVPMLEAMGKILDVIEDLLSKVDTTDPAECDKLVAIGSRLEALAMEIKDRTEAP